MERLTDTPDVLLIGNPFLFKVQQPAQEQDIEHPDFQHNLDILLESQRRCNGVGIAAPQIGWAVRVMSIGIEKSNPRYTWARNYPPEIWINPEVTFTSEELSWVWEGCLSVPGFRGWVKRPAAIRVKGHTRQGDIIEKELDGFMARVFQHEMDHLDGCLFPHRVQSPEHIVPLGSFEQQDQWEENWPTPGAYRTRPGEVSAQP